MEINLNDIPDHIKPYVNPDMIADCNDIQKMGEIVLGLLKQYEFPQEMAFGLFFCLAEAIYGCSEEYKETGLNFVQFLVNYTDTRVKFSMTKYLKDDLPEN